MLGSLVLPFHLMWQLQFEQAVARAEALSIMKQQFEGKALQYIAISKDELEGRGKRFVRIHAGEFVWDGIMYDIVESFPEAHQTWFLVYPDFKETEVLKQKIALARAFQSEEGLTSDSSKQSTTFYWISVKYATFLTTVVPNDKICFFEHSKDYCLQLTEQIEHPPQTSYLV
jgi:hypothetical protein